MTQLHHARHQRNHAHLTKIANAASAVRAELSGSNRATALGVEAHSPSPVLALCRALVEAGHDPATSLHAYRGDVLALKIRSIGEGAKLTVEDDSGGRPIFRRWRDRAESGGAAPPVGPTAPAGHPVLPSHSRRRGVLASRQTRVSVTLPKVGFLEGGDQ